MFFIVLAAVAGATTWWQRGAGVFGDTLQQALGLLLWISPVLVGALLVSAYVQRLVPRATMEHWLGGRSGLRGLTVATIAGAMTPGGPFTAFPLVVGLHRAGASTEVCVAYLTAWSVLGLNRVLVWELPFLGVDFVALRLLVSLPLPFLAGFATRLIIRWVRP
ncbi:permease [Aquisalimonas asiatica]|uniref:Predicted permease n=1 Tax=Aquisalimonas asiatica TaxID=406100 RepID=A0A1H8RPS7_9GAMM|nr:permease [Aquisalimonas asiatica]SEO68569.1 Predicted permease [Aquisalimonas asiatica]